ILLMLIVAVLPSILFPPKKQPVRRAGGSPDSISVARESIAPPAPAPAPPPAQPANRLTAPAETVWVTSPLYRLGFTTQGGALVSAALLDYKSFTPVDSEHPVQLVPPDRPMLVFSRAAGNDTTPLGSWRLTPSAKQITVGPEGATLTFRGEHSGAEVALEYRFFPDEYRVSVQGRMEGFGQTGGTLLLGMGDGMRTVEADTMDDYRHFAVVTKAAKTQSLALQSLNPGERKILDGPFEWAGVKSKYFFTAALAIEEN